MGVTFDGSLKHNSERSFFLCVHIINKYCGILLILILIDFLDLTSGNRINASWIESALQDWRLSSAKFEASSQSLPASHSMVGYDSKMDKVIILGGESYDGVYPDASNIVWIYDLIKNDLSLIPHVVWSGITNAALHDVLPSTNSVIINSTMYYCTEDKVIKLNLRPFYNYNEYEAPPSHTPEIIMSKEKTWGFIGEPCIVTDKTQKYLILAAQCCNRIVIVYEIETGYYWETAQTSFCHNAGVCVIMNDIFYIIGGSATFQTEYIEMSILLEQTYHGEIFNLYPDNITFPEFVLYSSSSYGCNFGNAGNFGVIQDDEHNLIYLIGGEELGVMKTQIRKMNVTNGSMELVDFGLPELGISGATTILFRKNGRIFVFRGFGGGHANEIAYTVPSFPIIDDPITTGFGPTSKSTQKTQYISENDSILTTTTEVIMMVIGIGLVCICCTVLVGIYIMNRMKLGPNSSNKGSKEHLMKVRSDSVGVSHDEDVSHSDEGMEENDDKCIEMSSMHSINKQKDINNNGKEYEGIKEGGESDTNSDSCTPLNEPEDDDDGANDVMPDMQMKETERVTLNSLLSEYEWTEMISESKMKELYQLFLKSRLECFSKCEEIGLTDQFMDQLLGVFEKFKQCDDCL